ncbi:MAG: hypothetical protein MUO21_08105, partial [Nitrososphaeraceae archaeon]|nr:hypothetical protein [Nitrososphaeraceae archaeon]
KLDDIKKKYNNNIYPLYWIKKKKMTINNYRKDLNIPKLISDSNSIIPIESVYYINNKPQIFNTVELIHYIKKNVSPVNK